jgi:uncharacterized membrane protein YfhO
LDIHKVDVLVKDGGEKEGCWQITVALIFLSNFFFFEKKLLFVIFYWLFLRIIC